MVRSPHRRRDEGSTLIMVLVLMVIGALIVVPMLSYAVVVLRANGVVVEKTERQEAVKAGLRVALADPLRLYEHCGGYTGGAIGAPVRNGGAPVNGVPVQTTCDLMAQASALEAEELHLGVAVTKAGATVPAGMNAVPVEAPDGTPVLDPDGNPLRYVYETGATNPVEAWWSFAPTAEQPDPPEHLATPLVESRHIWSPHLPSHGTEIRSTSHLMPPGYSYSVRDCRVLFPGIYLTPLVLDQDVDYYFTSGVYYFQDTVTIAGNADVVVGMGSVDGCVTDQEAAFYAIGAPTSHEISGLGATFVFGRHATNPTDGRLVVRQDGNTTPTIRFNQRYVHPVDIPGYASYGVSIASVNGWVNPADGTFHNLDLVGLNSVPMSRVGGVALPYDLDETEYAGLEIPPSVPIGSTGDDYTAKAYRPSQLTYEPGPPVLDADFVNGITLTAYRTSDTSSVRDNAGAVVLRWAHPGVDDMNGAPITSYTVTPSAGPPTVCTWTAPPAGTPAAPLECRFTGLPSPNTSGGTTTNFSIVANNGKPSSPVTKSITISRSSSSSHHKELATATPARPTIHSVTAYHGAAVVRFNPLTLAQSGYAPVQQYRVSYRLSTATAGTSGTVGCTVDAPTYYDPASFNPPLDALSCVIHGLPTTGSPIPAHRFQVNSTNYNNQASSVYTGTDTTLWTNQTTPLNNPAQPAPVGPTAIPYVPFAVPEKVPDPIVHIDLTRDDDDGLCVSTPAATPPAALAEAMRAVPAEQDVVVQIPGYIAVPQGLVQVDNPCARSRIIATGGVLAADINLNGPPGPGGDDLTVAIGIENPLVQRTVKIVTTTTSGKPLVKSTAVVQINETGEYRVNSWEVQ